MFDNLQHETGVDQEWFLHLDPQTSARHVAFMGTKRTLHYTDVILLLSSQSFDEIFLETEHQGPKWPKDSNPNYEPGPLRTRFEVPRDTGRQFIRDKFGCEPDQVIDLRS